MIAVTASSASDNRQQILAAGFDGFQPKPIEVTIFLAAVRDMLERRRAG